MGGPDQGCKDIALAVRQLVGAKHPIDRAADHASHLAIYLSDPDGNGIERALDHEPSFWTPWRNSDLTMADIRLVNKPVDLAALIAEAGSEEFPDL